MEPEAEDPDYNDNLVPWGSNGSQELYASESQYEDDASDAEYPLNPQPAHGEHLQTHGWESAGEQQPELSASEEDISYNEEDDISLNDSRGSITESPHAPTSPTSLSPHPEPQPERISRPHSQSSFSSLGCAADLTLALTLTTKQPLGASNRQDPRTGNRRAESSEEGGSSEAPPASVFFGISDEGAEQAEKRNPESDTDLCRPDSHRARCTRLGNNESQSERQVKETKSKCKRIARLLTDAPNPRNKGALLFKKRRQRVKKYTLVSYGTGVNKFDSKDQIEKEIEEVRSAGYNFVATSESESEEECSVFHKQHYLSLTWGSVREMEALPETKGKGVLMFAQRRKRMDEIVAEQEELRSKGIPAETITQPEPTETQDVYDNKYVHTNQANYVDVNLKQHVEYQEHSDQMNHVSNVSRSLVPNRTAKPFLGFQNEMTAPVISSVVSPVAKKQEIKFKVPVPVPVNANPYVWSPTGDIIASRDERISVPAIKTGILPESKRKVNNKQPSTQAQDLHLQNKGERRSYIESEDDFFSLGAEACNFMQPRTIKLKNPPPVAPKPAINPACPPWTRRSPSCEPFVSPRSPLSQPSQSSAGPHSQHYLQQQDWTQPQQMANQWAPDQTQATLQTPANAWAPVNPSSQLHLQPTNSWSQQSPRSPVSMQTRSPTYSPHHPPSPARNKPDSAPHSVASCPPQAGKSYVQASQASPMGRGVNRAGGGSSMAGKGAALFARRQTRMEKFVVDAESVQANKPRTPSPTSSLPNYWRYSSNVRAPPPLSYNPMLAPFYPPSAAKQPPSTSPKTKPKTKEKPKAPPKHLNALDIMKHQPYQLDSTLFKYDANPEAKSPSPKPTQTSKFEVTKKLKLKSAPSHSTHVAPEPAAQSKVEAPAKSPVSVSSQISSTRSAEPLANAKCLDEKHTVTPAAQHKASKQAPSVRPASTSSKKSSFVDSIASAFSPASLIARGARQMAPRPRFSAKKPAGFGRSRSLSLPRQMYSTSSSGLSPASTPGIQPPFLFTHRQTSCQERAYKPLSPWEAASKSPIGSVDEAFVFQSLPSSVASSVRAAGHRRSLPEPPDEWKRRVSLDPAAVSTGHYHAAPAFQAPSMSRTFSPEKPAFYGPPFRPAQPLRSASRASIGYMGQGSNPTMYSPLYSAAHRS
ncbi:Synaptopodin-2 Myopodin [Collichthys lucidus]|uniref:Synaptopodin-2 Myopodin n=1 Tax=Collichthys lucidus TaxID=240159 RepID=A0A4U5U2C8_COLLU|nr:Synaptopodin-2 Myopodin [Collichthys lucidus]